MALTGCLSAFTATPSTTNLGECALAATLDATDVHVGDTVHVLGGPLTGLDDTVVRVSGVQAALTANRTGCEACDGCVADSACDCTACAACEAFCADCVETVAFVVPDVAPGLVTVVMVNRYGATSDLSLNVLASDVTDTDTSVDTDTSIDTDTSVDTDTSSDTDTL